MIRTAATLSLAIVLIIGVVAPHAAMGGSEASQRLLNTGGAAGFNTQANAETQLSTIIGGIIKAATSLLGVIFVAQIVYAGFLWMTAGGEEDKITSAKKIIRRSIIGLAIVIAAWAISIFVLGAIYQATR